MPNRTVLYDAEGRDHSVPLTAERAKDLQEKQLLWVDVYPVTEEDLALLTECFEIETRALEKLRDPAVRPRLEMYGNQFLLKTNALESVSTQVESTGLVFFIGENFVITLHESPIRFLEAFRSRVLTDSHLGLLDSPGFLAALLDWHLGDFFRQAEELEREVDLLDEVALNEEEEERVLPKLIALRKRVGRVRRILSPHREVYSALLRPDFLIVSGSSSVESFRLLHERLERAIETIENTRDLLLGSFEVFSTQTAKRTNDIMKLLTIVSVTLLPIGALAGILGMNFRAAFFDTNDLGFYTAVSVMILLTAGILTYARRKRWI